MAPLLRTSSLNSSFSSTSSSHSKNSQEDGSFVLPESGIVFSQKEKDEYINQAYIVGQTQLVNMLIDVLLPQKSWISSAILFSATTLPQSLLPVWKFSTNIWKKHGSSSSVQIIDGDTEVHFDSYFFFSKLLVRHKFSDGWYYYRAYDLGDDEQQTNNVDEEVQLQEIVSQMINEHVTAGKRPRQVPKRKNISPQQ